MDQHESFKRFFKIYTETMIDLSSVPENERPMHLIAEFEKRSPAAGRQSVRLGVSDALADVKNAPQEKVALLSERLAAANAPPIASVRALMSKKLTPAIKRGVLKNEEEFYLVKDLLDSPSLPDDERTKLETMLDTFEFSR
ncbi:hypothetical protein ACVWWJ_001925 [Luteibacter sp. HA06]